MFARIATTLAATATTTALVLAAPSTVRADYDSHPELAPAARCANLPEGAADKDCQPLYWDFPAATEVGFRATTEPAGGYPHGLTDRPPPVFVADEDGDGVLEGYERNPAGTRERLCADPVEVPYWAPTGETAEGTDGATYEVYEVRCQRGTRLYFGPWSFSGGFEQIWRAVLRVENSARLDRDVAEGRIPADGRREWFVGMQIYNHLASHHANMWDPVKDCNDPDRPDYASSDECRATYQEPLYDESGCRSDSWAYPGEGPKRRCAANSALGNPSQWRAATQFPGRFEVEIPDGRALPLLEDQLWPMEHHVVSQVFYDGQTRNFASQNGGVVGEIVIQVLTASFDDPDLKRISVLFDTVIPVVTLDVPPFSLGTTGGVWYAPFDLELALLTTHSHKRTVRTWADKLPANPVRSNDANQLCGGSKNGQPRHLFESYSWDDANTCKYYDSPDGNIVLRKGEAIQYGCLFNNGITELDEIPDPTARDLVEKGVVGHQALHGTQAPSIYKVRFGCEENAGVPPGNPPAMPAKPCAATDDDQAYDAPDQCPIDDGYTGRCVPAHVVWGEADDEMCIVIGMYWPLDRPVDVDADVRGKHVQAGIENQDPSEAEKAVVVGDEPVVVDPDKFDTENPERSGSPGTLPRPVTDVGKCDDCSEAVPHLF